MRIPAYFFLLLLLLAACSPSESTPATPQVVVMEITATPLPATATVPPTATPIPEPTRTARPSPTGTPISSTADGCSTSPVLSRDGRYIVFESSAYNMSPTTPKRNCNSEVDGDRSRPCRYIYLYDRESDELTFVSAKFNGIPADGNSYSPVISDDGRYIAYISGAKNLDTEETLCQLDDRWGPCPNIFVYDRTTRRTRWVSRPFSEPRPTGIQNIVPSSLSPSLSGDGRYIAYMSRATNLVENDENSMADVFVFDQESGTNRLISVSSDGEPGNGPSASPSISGDGRIVVFTSFSNNLVPDDVNNTVDIFAHDLETGVTTRLSVASDGTESDGYSDSPSVSNDGRYVIFESIATTLDPNDLNYVCDLDGDNDASENCMDVFLHDRETGTTTLVSLSANGGQNFDSSLSGQISGDGRSVVFANRGSGLVPQDGNDVYDVFIRDLVAEMTTRISVASDGTEGDHQSGITDDPFLLRPNYSLSSDGRFVVFGSSSTNFVDEDFNDGESCEPPLDESEFVRSCSDIFLHDRETGETILISSPRKTRN